MRPISTHKVTDVFKVSEADRSGLADSGENILTRLMSDAPAMFVSAIQIAQKYNSSLASSPIIITRCS